MFWIYVILFLGISTKCDNHLFIYLWEHIVHTAQIDTEKIKTHCMKNQWFSVLNKSTRKHIACILAMFQALMLNSIRGAGEICVIEGRIQR